MISAPRMPAVALLAALAAAAPAAPAAARTQTLAPPGNSAITQYLETVPTDRGQSPPGGGPGGALPPSQRRHLEHLGSAGRALANLVDATAPVAAAGPAVAAVPAHGAPGGATTMPRSGGSGGATAVELPPQLRGGSGKSPASALLSAAVGHGGGGGLEIFLPGLLLAGVLLLAVRLIRGRRTA